jgi:acetyl esterase/lipase
MGVLATVATLLKTGGGTAVRRLTRGAQRPGWSWEFETTVAVLKATAERLAHEAPATQRRIMDALSRPSDALRRVRQVPVRAGGVPATWFIPPEPSEAVVLYLHGGGYVFGSLRTHGDFMARLALASGARVLGLDYRLAPEHPFPAALEDAVAAWRWLVSTGVAPERAVLAGDSAGGGLAVATMLALRGRGEPRPAGGLLMAPWVDLSASVEVPPSHVATDWIDRATGALWASWYLGGADAKDPLASPLHADLRGLPPLYVQLGGAEVLHAEGVRFAERAREAGVEVEVDVWPEMVHVFPTFGTRFRESVRATERMAERVRALTSGPARTWPAVAARRASTG